MKEKSISEIIENASDEEMELMLFSVLKWFKARRLGNPFNYNRAFEWLQSRILGFTLEKVGGGSDGKDINGVTAEFKASAWKGYGAKGQELTNSFTYNGTSRFEDWDEQEDYCRKKIFRDPYHFWSIIDYMEGKFVKTLKVPAETVSNLLMPKWTNSWENPNKKDPRIGGSVSTKDLVGEEFEIIPH